jgi:hypothetical protein
MQNPILRIRVYVLTAVNVKTTVFRRVTPWRIIGVTVLEEIADWSFRSDMKTEAAGPSETSVPIYHSTSHHVSEDRKS